jgi:hypothetical protein
MGRHNNREQVYIIRFGTHSVVKKASVIALNHNQAERMAQNFPNVKGVFKAQRDYEGIERGEFRNFTNKVMADNKPMMTALALDEFIWLRRNKRIENKDKDKLDNP